LRKCWESAARAAFARLDSFYTLNVDQVLDPAEGESLDGCEKQGSGRKGGKHSIHRGAAHECVLLE
jgi:hypothetical protein